MVKAVTPRAGKPSHPYTDDLVLEGTEWKLVQIIAHMMKNYPNHT